MIWSEKSLFFLLTGLVLFTLGCEPENAVDTIHFQNQSLGDIRAFEKGINSELRPGFDNGKVIKAFLPEHMDTQWERSLFYYRPTATDFPMRVKYYFDPSTADSTVKLVTYEWNVIGPDLSQEEIVKKTENLGSYEAAYKAKYNALAQAFLEQLGPQLQGDPSIKTGELNLVKQQYNKLVWQVDRTVVELELRIAIGFSARIFCKVYWVDKQLESDTDQNQITF